MTNQEIIRNWITLAQFFMNWVSGVNVLIQNEGLRENVIEELGDNHMEMLFKFGEQFNTLPTPESLNKMRPFISKITEYVGNAVKENSVSKAASILSAVEGSSPKIMQKLIDLAREINSNTDVFYASSHIELDGGEEGHAELFKKLSTEQDIQIANDIWMAAVNETGLVI